MPSSYTTSLKLTLPATGENSGTWGTLVNDGITTLIDRSIAGTTSISLNNTTDYTLSIGDGSSPNESRYMFITATGALTSTWNVICPALSKLYVFTNNTTGGYAVTFKTSAGAGISVPNGKRVVLYCNGTDVLDGITHANSLTLGTALPVTSGGTGVTTSTGSGANVLATSPTLVTPLLGTPTSGVMTNVTGLPLTTGVTGTLPATNGGTGHASYAVGDILYASTTTALSKLADVATGNALISGGVGVAPSWGKVGLTTHVTGTLPVGNGGTGAATLTGVLKGNGTSAFTAATAGTDYVAPGGALGIPSSGTLTNTTGLPLTTGVTGTLPVGNGGTGAATLAANNVLLGNGTSALQAVAPGSSGNVLTSNGTTWQSTAPSGGSVALNNVTAATGSATIANGNNPIAWNWTQTTAAQTGFAIGETTASTGGAGSQYLMSVGTLASSTSKVLKLSSGGATVADFGTSIAFTPAGSFSATVGSNNSLSLSTPNLATASNTGPIQLTVGNNTTTGIAGIITLQGGSSRATQVGNSGGIELKGGAAGAVASIAGGPIVLTAGAGSTTTTGGVGGAVTITAGAGGLALAGGIATLAGGNGGATGAGGAVAITAGNGNSALGGDITLTTGTGSTNGAVNFVNTNVANGAVATTVTSLGPTGSSTTIVGWLKIKVGGVTQYIPYW